MKTKAHLKGCFMKTTDDWKTPSEIYYKYVIANDYKDPCEYKAKEKYNGLEKNYHLDKIFLNPPFSQMEQWTDWVIKQAQNNNKIVMLIPARTDTHYFHRLLKLKPTIIFIEGRLKYENEKGAKTGAPFPSLLLIFQNATMEYYISRKREEI